MKLSYSILIFFFLSIHSFSQSDPIYRSEGLRSFWFNPATVATTNKLTANSNYGVRWAQYTFAAHNLHLNAAYKFITIGTSPTNSIGKGAVGFMYNREVSGLFTSQTFLLPINLQFKLKGSWLSFGAAPGYRKLTVDQWVPPTTSPDPVVPSEESSNFTMDLGVNWFNAQFSLGLAARHLVETRNENDWYQNKATYYLHGSYILKSIRNINLKGLMSVRTDFDYTSLCLMAYVNYGELPISIGGGIRDFHSPVFGVYGRLFNFSVGYFIELYNSELTNSPTPAHEFRLAFEIFDLDILNDKSRIGATNF